MSLVRQIQFCPLHGLPAYSTNILRSSLERGCSSYHRIWRDTKDESYLCALKFTGMFFFIVQLMFRYLCEKEDHVFTEEQFLPDVRNLATKLILSGTTECVKWPLTTRDLSHLVTRDQEPVIVENWFPLAQILGIVSQPAYQSLFLILALSLQSADFNLCVKLEK